MSLLQDTDAQLERKEDSCASISKSFSKTLNKRQLMVLHTKPFDF